MLSLNCHLWLQGGRASYSHGGDRETKQVFAGEYGRVRIGLFSISWLASWTFGLLRVTSVSIATKQDCFPGHLKNSNDIQTFIDLGQLTFRPFSYEIGFLSRCRPYSLYLVKSKYRGGRWGNFSVNASMQSDERNEFNIRRNNRSSSPTLALNLTSYQLDVWQKLIIDGIRSLGVY